VRIVVNHLTRMQPGFICVAGLELDSDEHVRPSTGDRLSNRLLARYGGPFDIGAIVDLGPTRPAGRPPELEDYSFQPRHARAVGHCPPDEFWARLEAVSSGSLTDLFGRELTRRGPRSCAVDAGRGAASLGCLVPAEPPTLDVQPRPGRPDSMRLRVRDGRLALDLGVTDIRLYGPDHVTPDRARIADVAARLGRGVRTILAVGLTRATAGSPDYPPVHWLQVNSIHLADDPAWRLAERLVVADRRAGALFLAGRAAVRAAGDDRPRAGRERGASGAGGLGGCRGPALGSLDGLIDLAAGTAPLPGRVGDQEGQRDRKQHDARERHEDVG
jgi:hypothetical protein